VTHDPERISAILEVRPTKAHRKGERYFAGLVQVILSAAPACGFSPPMT
jgi:hypothetical protein